MRAEWQVFMKRRREDEEEEEKYEDELVIGEEQNGVYEVERVVEMKKKKVSLRDYGQLRW